MKSFVIFLFCFSLISVAYGQIDSRKYFTENPFKDFSIKKYGIVVKIDPRIELLQTLMLLAGNPHINNENLAYKMAVLDKFEGLKNHSSINTFRDILRKKFNSLDAPIFFFMRLTEYFELRTDIDNSTYQEDKEIQALLELIKNLAIEMDFVSFFNQNKLLYQTTLSTFEYNLIDFDEKSRMLNYYKLTDNTAYDFQIVLNLLGKGNFGPGLQTTNSQELYAIISPNASIGNLPAFDLNEVHYLVWHEFSHSFVNPLIDKYYDEFHKSGHLFLPIKGSMEAQAYTDWKVTLKEHLVRAVTCRLAAQKYGNDFAEWNYTIPEIGKKYIYLPIMLDELKAFENNTNQSFEQTVKLIANKLNNFDTTAISQILAKVEEIRKPNVEDFPKIGEVKKDILLIIPENVALQSKKAMTWPGVEMKKYKEGWYYYQIENTSKANLIFNNNKGLQTEDLLNITGTKFYDWDKKKWVNPDKPFDISQLQKGNSILLFFKAPKNWKEKPNIYVWEDDAQNSFADFIQRYKSYFQNAQIVTDKDALTMDLTVHDLVVFGNFQNNSFLRTHYANLPVKFTQKGFVADRSYEADDLVLITAWLHPTNPERKSELYISHDLENIANIDWVQRGGTHYHITRRLITLKYGNYTRRMKIWRF